MIINCFSQTELKEVYKILNDLELSVDKCSLQELAGQIGEQPCMVHWLCDSLTTRCGSGWGWTTHTSTIRQNSC